MGAWLKNGNPVGDFSKAPRCGAHARTTGKPCLAPAMLNGRCRMHGGRSTGPRTSAGLRRTQKANFKHGAFSLLEPNPILKYEIHQGYSLKKKYGPFAEAAKIAIDTANFLKQEKDKNG